MPFFEELKPFHVREGRIWVYRGLTEHLPYAVLDGETLAPVGSNSLALHDSLVATEADWFGGAP
jgi:hypothetical protein